MIYTVTFNPAIDYVIHMERLERGSVNRTTGELIQFGGKGINVSTVLGNLGVENVALGFLAGFTGDAIQQGLTQGGVRTDFIRLSQGLTRINVKIKAGDETDINGTGPAIGEKDLEALYQKLDQLQKGDILVLAGSIPATLPSDIYERILERLDGRDILPVVDAERDLLCNVLKYHPFLIKPNNFELGAIFDRVLETDEEIQDCAAQLQARGARNVLVSMAAKGAILLDEAGTFHKIAAPDGVVRNSVGAGDSMVAGFLAGWLQSKDYQFALRMGSATGSATAFSDGLATKEQVEAVLKTF